MSEANDGMSFTDRMMEVLSQVEYRRMESGEDLAAVARLRYKAYKKGGTLSYTSPDVLDASDTDRNAHVLGLYLHGEMICTVRLHYVTPDHRVSQSSNGFADEINALLDSGLTLIDPARFAADPAIAGEYSWIPFMMLRPAIAAAAFYGADRVMQHIQTDHIAFYKRVFYADTIVPPKYCPSYDCVLSLMSTDTRRTGHKLLTRFPFFKTTPSERNVMFSKAPGSQRFMTVVPTAKYIAADDMAYELPEKEAAVGGEDEAA
jgi:N-acyl-L-homoserine lactone synthetase